MLNALIPVFSIILIGYILRTIGFPGTKFWDYAESSTYYIFFPALLLYKLGQFNLLGQESLSMLAAILFSIVLLAGLLFLIKFWTRYSGPVFSSIFQGGLRMNTFVGLAGISALLGDEGLALSGVALMGMIPLVNLLCVPAVIGLSQGDQPSEYGVSIEVARNPLILACLGGFLLSQLPFSLPSALLYIFDLLGRAALPLGLLAVGASLKVQSVNANIGAIAVSSVVKLFLYPSLTALLAYLFGITGSELTVAVFFSGLPTAMSSYILARQLGGDKDLMAATITTQTILSAVSLPLVLQIWT